MKPVVGVMNAWTCVVVSCFAIIILSILGSLFSRNHHSMMGQTTDPDNGAEVAFAIFMAVVVYAVFLVFCGFQAYLHIRASRKGRISLT